MWGRIDRCEGCGQAGTPMPTPASSALTQKTQSDPNHVVRIALVVDRLSLGDVCRWGRLLSVGEPTHVVVSGLYLGELAADEGAELW